MVDVSKSELVMKLILPQTMHQMIFDTAGARDAWKQHFVGVGVVARMGK